MLTQLVINRVKENAAFKERFEELGISEIDIRRVLSEIFEGKPIIGIPVDHVGVDLHEWAQTLKTEVKLWVIRKLVEFGNPDNMIYEIPEDTVLFWIPPQNQGSQRRVTSTMTLRLPTSWQQLC